MIAFQCTCTGSRGRRIWVPHPRRASVFAPRMGSNWLSGNLASSFQEPTTRCTTCFVSGHDFSRAATPAKNATALAPAISPQVKFPFSGSLPAKGFADGRVWRTAIALIYWLSCCSHCQRKHLPCRRGPDPAQEIATKSALRPGSSVVERGPEKAGVGGSIPSLATTRIVLIIKSLISAVCYMLCVFYSCFRGLHYFWCKKAAHEAASLIENTLIISYLLSAIFSFAAAMNLSPTVSASSSKRTSLPSCVSSKSPLR